MTYQAPSGRCEVQDTINRYDDYAIQAFCRAVVHLGVETADKWDEPHAKKLKSRAK